MRTNYVLVDYENVQVASLALLADDHFRVKVFLGPNNTKLQRELVLSMHELGPRASYVTLETPGRNSLDFHIAFHLGLLASTDPTAFFHIISRDTGFDPLIKHLKANKIYAARSESIEAMPCFTPPKASLPPPEATPARLPASAQSLVEVALSDLIKRKTSKPRTTKTLMSTLHAKLGKELPLSEIEVVYQDLIDRGYVKVENTKVSYALPAQP